MARNENTGIRIIHFKDFCFESSSSTPPYTFWESLNAHSNWSVVAGVSPSINAFSTGNKYMASGGASPTRAGVLRSISTNLWCNTDQNPVPATNRNAIQYDIMLNSKTGGIGGLLFFWDGGILNSCYALIHTGTDIGLYRVTGDPSVLSNYDLLETVATGLSVDTEYWCKVLYFPSDVSFHGKTSTVAGTFRIWVDTTRLMTGSGGVAIKNYTDATPISTGGDYLGLVHYSSTGEMYFDGIEFADDFLPMFQGHVHKARLMFKGVGSLNALVADTDDLTPCNVGDRVEFCVNNIGTDGQLNYRCCVFDGVIQEKKYTKREKQIMLSCFDETYELVRSGSNEPVDTTYVDYLTYLQQALFGEYFAWRGKNSRLNMSAIPLTSGYGDVNISDDWEYDVSDFDMINALSWICGVICSWSPDGFFLANNLGYSTGVHIDLDQTAPGPRPILWYHIDDTLIDYVNRVKLYNSSSSPVTSEDTVEQDERGIHEEKIIMTPLPASEATYYADKYLAAMKDTTPFVELVSFAHFNELFPGCVVTLSSDEEGWDSIPMIVIEKFQSTREWEDEDQYDIPPGSTFLRLAYFDPDAQPLRPPRLYWPSNEEKVAHEINRQKKQEQSMTRSVTAGGGVATTDEFVKVTVGDTTAGYLYNKVSVSEGANASDILEISRTNPGANEVLDIQLDEDKFREASAVAKGVVGTGAQTFTGDKTFNSDMTILGDIILRVVSSSSEPVLDTNNKMCIWIDSDDGNSVWLLFRRGSGDQVRVELR